MIAVLDGKNDSWPRGPSSLLSMAHCIEDDVKRDKLQ